MGFGLTNCTSIVSNILDINEAMNLYSLCHFSDYDTFKLVYAGSRDGYSNEDFHRKCDNISKALVIYKTIDGFIFGGYAETSWDNVSLFKYDDKAFIFSLKNKVNKKIKIKVCDSSSAVDFQRRDGSSFGKSDMILQIIGLVNKSLSKPESFNYSSIKARSLGELFPFTGICFLVETEVYKKM